MDKSIIAILLAVNATIVVTFAIFAIAVMVDEIRKIIDRICIDIKYRRERKRKSIKNIKGE